MTGARSKGNAPSSAAQATLNALVERIYPETSGAPGAGQLGLAATVWALASGPAGRGLDSYRQPPFAGTDVPGLGWQWQATFLEALEHGLDVVHQWSVATHGVAFVELAPAEQEHAVARLEAGTMPGFELVSAAAFFELLYGYVFDALFVVPASGGYSLDAVWGRLGVGPEPGRLRRP
jgi:gluconate 2-dehydrogenase gamma chain